MDRPSRWPGRSAAQRIAHPLKTLAPERAEVWSHILPDAPTYFNATLSLIAEDGELEESARTVQHTEWACVTVSRAPVWSVIAATCHGLAHHQRALMRAPYRSALALGQAWFEEPR